MLDANLTAQLQTHLEQVTQPIELVASLDDSPKSAELRELLDEIAALSDQDHRAPATDDDARRPSFAIDRVGTDVARPLRRHPDGPRVHLARARPAAGRRPPVHGDAETIEPDPRRSTASYDFETYFSLTCQNCPDVVQALNLMSVLNPSITPRRHRRRAVPGRGRRAPGHGACRRCSSTASRSTRAA